MAKRRGSPGRKTRHKLKKSVRRKGKISLTSYFQQFTAGDSVIFVAEPAVQKGRYHPRFHGKRGIVKGKKGMCYEITMKDQAKEKIVVVHPVHLKKA